MNAVSAGPAPCEACQEPILFILVRNNAGHRMRHMPVNAEPDPGGNVAVLPERTGALIGRVLGKGQKPAGGETLYCPHFATCAQPDRFRRRRRSGNWTAAHRQPPPRRARPPGAALFRDDRDRT